MTRETSQPQKYRATRALQIGGPNGMFLTIQTGLPRPWVGLAPSPNRLVATIGAGPQQEPRLAIPRAAAALTTDSSFGDMAHRSLAVAGTNTVSRNCVASVTSLGCVVCGVLGGWASPVQSNPVQSNRQERDHGPYKTTATVVPKQHKAGWGVRSVHRIIVLMAATCCR